MHRMLCGLAAAAFTGAPAAAITSDFEKCDGYPAPGKRTDGLSTASDRLGLFTGNLDSQRARVAVGGDALAACAAALVDLRLEPRYWLRRAHLLQSKALHLIVIGRDEDALAALRESDAASPPSAAWFQDSIGSGNRALRAIPLYRLNRREEARAELAAVVQARPYASSLRALARTIRTGFEDADTYFTLLKNDARYDSELLIRLFRSAILYGRLDEAAAAYGQIDAAVITGHVTRTQDEISEAADLAGAMSYTLAAQGKAQAAAALMSKARADVETAMARPASASATLGDKAQRDYDRRLEAGLRGKTALDGWEKAIALRTAAPTADWKPFSETLPAALPDTAPVAVDLVGQARAGTEQERRSRGEAVAALTQAIDSQRRTAALNYPAIARMLPRPDLPRAKPKYLGVGKGLILDPSSGFGFRPHKGTQALTVGYWNKEASPAVIEEIGMLAAATKTLRLGKDSFIVEARVTFRRMVTKVGGTSVTPYPDGYEVAVRFLPVSRAALPPELEAGRWRLIDAGEIYRRLNPKYDSPGAS